MPATSKSQQKIMAMALAYKRGSLKDASDSVKKIANSMTMKELEKFASTDTKNLPDKVKNETISRGNGMTNSKLMRKLVADVVAEVLNEGVEEQKPNYTPEQKKEFMEAISKFNEYGANIYRKTNIVESYKKIKSIVEFASHNLVEESGEWFDNVTAGRHSKRLKESFKVFEKTMSEYVKLQQRLESSYEDIGETLNKYYKIHSKENRQPQNESKSSKVKKK